MAKFCLPSAGVRSCQAQLWQGCELRHRGRKGYAKGMNILRILAAVLMLAIPARADEASALREALALASGKDWTAAARAAEGAGPVGPDIVEWLRLRAGDGLLEEYESFLQRRADWPGMPFLRQKGEAAVARSTTPSRVIAYFGNGKPATAQGAIALTAALNATGRQGDAGAVAARAWVDLRFAADEETALLALAPAALAKRHEARLDRLLWDGRGDEVRRMLPRVSGGWRALAEARLALQADKPGVNGLIAAVPNALAGDPGLAEDRFQWRMNKGLYDGAAELILAQSTSAEALGQPEVWAPRRASLARELMERGQGRLAYRVASSHRLTSGGNFADLEFLTGFIALTRLGDPDGAKAHFAHLLENVRTPISLSRAYYWIGRAEEAAGRADAARAAYASAAAHPAAYYGLLAAEKLGRDIDASLLSDRRPADWRQAPWARSPVLAAARLLLLAGDRNTGKRFLLHFAEGLDGQGLDQLADMALTMGEPHVAVLIAKQAAERGTILSRAYFPVPSLVPDALPVSRALALAIARRESEFDPAVISPAGARGLMQVMPATAEAMARETGQPYVGGRLTTDPAYNASLGAAYLKKLVDEFGPAVALIAAGYNAGPGRPRRWIQTLGDPRAPGTNVVDWVETVPIGETRTYIMRVSESLVIYRAKLRGSVGPVRLTSELTGN